MSAKQNPQVEAAYQHLDLAGKFGPDIQGNNANSGSCCNGGGGGGGGDKEKNGDSSGKEKHCCEKHRNQKNKGKAILLSHYWGHHFGSLDIGLRKVGETDLDEVGILQSTHPLSIYI